MTRVLIPRFASPVFVALLLISCVAPATTSTAPAPPTLPAPPPADEPAGPPPPFSVELRPDGATISTLEEINDAIVIPGGVLLAHDNTIWRLDRGGRDLQEVTKSIDPHGMASDGTWLYWFSEEENARLNLETLERELIEQLEPAGLQYTFAMGELPYALTGPGMIWWYRGRDAYVVDRPKSADGRLGPLGLRAGGRVAVLSKVRPDGTSYLKRAQGGRTKDAVESDSAHPRRFSVDPEGRLLFLRGEGVLRLNPGTSEAQFLFELPDLTALCWCGEDICTISAESQALVRHSGPFEGPSHSVETLRPVNSDVHTLSCNADAVAWTSRETGYALHVVWLPEARDGGEHAP
mgnify:CR=1 FL=1